MKELIIVITIFLVQGLIFFLTLITLRKRYAFVAVLMQGKFKEAYGFNEKEKMSFKLTLMKWLKFIIHFLVGISFEVLITVGVIALYKHMPIFIFTTLSVAFGIEVYYLTRLNSFKLKDLFKTADINMCDNGNYIVNYTYEDSNKYDLASSITSVTLVVLFIIEALVLLGARNEMEIVATKQYVIDDVVSIVESNNIESEDNKDNEYGTIGDIDVKYYFSCTDEEGKKFTILLNGDEIKYVIPNEDQTESYLWITTTNIYTKSAVIETAEYKMSKEIETYAFSLMTGDTISKIEEVLD